jgi:hypothetical protein
MRFPVLSLLILVMCDHATAQKTPTVVTRYTWTTGKIDNYPVTFHLYRINNEFTGFYYYNNTEQAITVSGKMDAQRFLKLNHASVEVFEGTFRDSVFSGTWSSKGKLLPFRVAQKKDDHHQRHYV